MQVLLYRRVIKNAEEVTNSQDHSKEYIVKGNLRQKTNHLDEIKNRKNLKTNQKMSSRTPMLSEHIRDLTGIIIHTYIKYVHVYVV